MRLSAQGGRWRGLWLAAALLLTLHTLIAYGLPPSVPLAGTLLLAVFGVFGGAVNAFAIAVSLAVGTLLYAGALGMLDWRELVYYRPTERLAAYDYRHDHRAFEPGQRLQMRIRHGDLQSMASLDISQPHDVLFVTDGRGMRNDADYAGEAWLLVGDSFIAGVNNTQADLLANQLRRQHALAAYQLGFPGDVDDYLAYVAGFRADHGEAAQVALFLFEGNDFPAAGEYEPQVADPLVRRLYKRWIGLYSETGVYRFTASLYKRWRNLRAAGSDEQVLLAEVYGRAMAFYHPYIEASEAPDYRPDAEFDARLRSLLALSKRVFFIPTKYRVHHALIRPGDGLAHSRWQYLQRLCEEIGVECVDLGVTLEAAALQAGRAGAIWWRDDTHWNAQGIAAAAAIVATSLHRRP